MDYVADKSPAGAERIRDRISATVDLLALYPQAGQGTSRAGVRRVVLTPYPYVIFYRTTAREIIILRFRHAARKPL